MKLCFITLCGKYALAYVGLKTKICTMKLSKEQVCIRLGERIREERVKQGLTLERLAHEAEIDYSQLNRIELGKINTSIYQIYQICHFLKIPLTDIFKSIIG